MKLSGQGQRKSKIERSTCVTSSVGMCFSFFRVKQRRKEKEKINDSVISFTFPHASSRRISLLIVQWKHDMSMYEYFYMQGCLRQHGVTSLRQIPQ